jgi:antitoxin ChpS
MKSQLRKIGNSTGAIFPAVLLNKLGLSAGDDIVFEQEGDKVFIASSKPKYKLDDLLAKCDESAPMPIDLTQWDELQPVGNEAW